MKKHLSTFVKVPWCLWPCEVYVLPASLLLSCLVMSGIKYRVKCRVKCFKLNIYKHELLYLVVAVIYMLFSVMAVHSVIFCGGHGSVPPSCNCFPNE